MINLDRVFSNILKHNNKKYSSNYRQANKNNDALFYVKIIYVLKMVKTNMFNISGIFELNMFFFARRV
jgi:hypothetical protein